jgi:hypothetical protein
MVELRAGGSIGGLGSVDLSHFEPGTPAFYTVVLFVGLVLAIFIVVGSLL